MFLIMHKLIGVISIFKLKCDWVFGPRAGTQIAHIIQGSLFSDWKVLKCGKKDKQQREALEWCPPPPNKVKWNVDGSSKGNLGPAGIRGILRDDKGIVKACFATSIGVRDSNEAEYMAIVFALEMSVQKEWLKDMEIIVESDSKNALAWINKREECPWCLRFYCNKLHNLLLVLKNVTFIHKNREANHCADALAKTGSEGEGTWLLWT